MTTTILILKRTVFILTILFFILLFVGLILFEAFSLEFSNYSYRTTLFLNLTYIIPVALLLTMTGTIKKKNSKKKNSNISSLTIFGSLSIFLIMLIMITKASWGGWTNETILYRNTKNKNITVNQQIWDVGTLGYDRDSRRIVKIRQVLKYFNQVKNIDTTRLDKNEWKLVNEEGDIHYP